MKMIRIVSVLSLVIVLLAACSGRQPEVELAEGQIDAGVYRNAKLGWEFRIPEGWEVLSKSEIERIEGKGIEAIEESYDSEITPSHTPLLYLRKDMFNAFTSTAQVFDPKVEGSYREHQEMIFEVLLNTCRSKGMRIDHKRDRESIGGLEFETLHVTLYAPDGKKVVLYQVIFDRLMNGRSLIMSITYNNHKDRDTLLNSLRQSQFKNAGGT